jgi:Flp pilus assembly protein protease CpaA
VVSTVLGLIVPLVVVAGVVIVAVILFRRAESRRAELSRRQAEGEVPYETRAHLTMRLTLAGILFAAAIVITIFLARR